MCRPKDVKPGAGGLKLWAHVLPAPLCALNPEEGKINLDRDVELSMVAYTYDPSI